MFAPVKTRSVQAGQILLVAGENATGGSGAANADKWASHKRNARDDLKAAFSKDFTEIHAVVMMTDSDNSGQRAQAWCGHISFSENKS
jgi:hypothetical protein